MNVKTTCIELGCLVAGIGVTVAISEYSFQRSKVKVKKILPSLLVGDRSEMRGRNLRGLLAHHGIRLSYARFCHLMAQLEDEDFLTKKNGVDEDGRFQSYRLVGSSTDSDDRVSAVVQKI